MFNAFVWFNPKPPKGPFIIWLIAMIIALGFVWYGIENDCLNTAIYVDCAPDTSREYIDD